MICPINKMHGGGIYCQENQCAWWSGFHSSCVAQLLSPRLWDIGDQLQIIAEELPKVTKAIYSTGPV